VADDKFAAWPDAASHLIISHPISWLKMQSVSCGDNFHGFGPFSNLAHGTFTPISDSSANV
jgi:hypothetical protein